MVDYFNQRMISEQNQVSYNYDTFRQNLELSWSPGWDYSNEIDACNVVIAAFARQMAGQDLGAAVGGAKQTRKKRAWDHNLLYSQTNATKANVKAMQPVVRTQCYFQEWYYDGAPTDVPLADDEEFMPFPIIPDYTGTRDSRYFIPVKKLNVSHTATQWVPIPAGPSNTSLGVEMADYPSALLVIQNAGLPVPFNASDIVTCSLQADWVPGTSQASWVNLYSSTSQQSIPGEQDLNVLWNWASTQGIYNWPFFNKKQSWRSISMPIEWLSTLTPQMDPHIVGRTSIASLIEMRMSQQYPARYLRPDTDEIRFTALQLNTIVASIVADGLSRFGWEENYTHTLFNSNVSYSKTDPDLPGWHWRNKGPQAMYDAFIGKRAKFMPNKPYRSDVREMFKMTVTVAGYALKSDGVAYYLAFSVFFMYFILVLMHISYIVYQLIRHRSRISDTWSSLTDLLLLSQSSPPPKNVLQNTCSGVEARRSRRLPLRLRAFPHAQVGAETLRLLVDEEAGVRVDSEKVYGAKT